MKSPVRATLGGLVTVLLVTPAAWSVSIATYNPLNFTGSTRLSQLKVVTSNLHADILITQEMASSSAPTAFLNNVLNATGGPGGYALATFFDGPDTDSALFYKTSRFTFNSSDPDSFKRLTTDLRDIDRWKLRPVGYTSNDSAIYIYSMHLKSGTSQSDQNQRTAEATIARADANNLPAGTNFIYAGDLNTYNSSETCYSVQLTGTMANNNGRGFDPINQPGAWHDGSGFATIHSQSTCTTGNCPSGGATGGMDDRFDQLLISAALKDSGGFDYVPNTYIAYGNDGQHFNTDIDGGGFNNAVGLTIATNLRQASDHLPVRADFQVPATISTTAMDFGVAFVSAAAQKTLTVTNTGDLALFGNVSPLNYTLPAAPSGFSGPAGSFVANPGAAGNNHVYTMDTAAAGPRSGTLVVTSNADTPTVDVGFTGSVLTHARPSTTNGSETTSATLDFGSRPAGSFANRLAQAHNYDYTSTQGLLEVYAAQVTGPDAARFSIEGGFSPATVGDTPASYTIAFDDGGTQIDTTYTATLTLQNRDPAGITGSGNLSDLTFMLTAHVTECYAPRYDYNGDGYVDSTDFGFFDACFSGPSVPFATGCGCSDGDNDGDVDMSDFGLFQRCYRGPGNAADPDCAN